MVNTYRHLALSDTPLARTARRLYWGVRNLSVPAPRVVVRPLLWLFLAVRSLFYFVKRVFICEPLFKAYCTRYGRNLRTDVFVHWVQGHGEILIGDDVTIDGKCAFVFSSRYVDRPVLEIGDRSGIGHNCSFTVGKRITIGRDCMISGGTVILDSSGHPTDPAARLAHLPPSPEEVRPVEIGDNVWIGMGSLVLPGVKIGDGSIVTARSVVRYHVRPYTIVSGNPARKIADLPRPAESSPPGEDPEAAAAMPALSSSPTHESLT
jgi:acetyltransferase-like isoleucine patch superfamily enzyme